MLTFSPVTITARLAVTISHDASSHVITIFSSCNHRCVKKEQSVRVRMGVCVCVRARVCVCVYVHGCS